MSVPGVTNFPSSLDDVVSLFNTANLVHSKVSGAVTNSQTTLTLLDASGWPPTGSITFIDGGANDPKEICYYVGRTGNTLTGVLRGQDGSSAQAHLTLTSVELRYTSRHHQVLSEGLRTVQAKLGIGASTPTTVGHVLTVSSSGVTGWAAPSGSGTAAWGGITGTLGNQSDLAAALGTKLVATSNLSDLVNAGTARTNLGLGSLATQSGTFSGTHSGTSSNTNTGDQTSVTGNAGTATALQNARTINGTSFDGTSNITVPAAAGTLTGATLASGVTASSLLSAAGGSFGSNAFNSTAFITGSTGATDKAILRASGTAGSTVQNSLVTISDIGRIVANVTNTGSGLSGGIDVELTASAASNTSGSQALKAGVLTTGSVNYTSYIAALDLNAEVESTGTIGNLYSVNAFTYNGASPTVSLLAGAIMSLQSDTGAVATVRGYYTDLTVNGGTVANRYGLRVANPDISGGGFVTNNYGVYVDSQTAGGTLNYSFFAVGGLAHFGGIIEAGSGPTTLTDSTGKIISAALNTVQLTQGGTGLTALGTALQQLRVNAGGTALEYFTPVFDGGSA